MQKVIVIGSGIGGLSAAIRLANKGFEVIVYESNSDVGGKLSEIQLGQYRFDAGPSLFTMPSLLEELFASCNKKLSDYFEYQQLEIITHYFYENGVHFTSNKDSKLFAQTLENAGLCNAEEIEKYLELSKEYYSITEDVFLRNSLHKISTYTKFRTLGSLLKMYRLPLSKNLHQYNELKINNKLLVQYFDRFATYNGSNPYIAPALLSLIPHLEHNIGAFYPKNGMYSIAKALKKLAIEMGVQFYFNTKVTEIVIEKNRVGGVVANYELVKADYVFSNMDIYFTYKNLLPIIKMPANILKQEMSSSAIVFYWGIKKEFLELGLHNILFSEKYEQEFNDTFGKKTIAKDSTVYINISSKYTKEDAPQNCENWFVMINVPHNNGWQNWDDLIAMARQTIINKINRILKTDIEKYIEVEDYLDPRKIEIKASSFGGSLYGSASNSKWAAFLRHKNFSSTVKNLFFCGGSVHPGGGIPLALLSGKIAVDCMNN